MPCNLADLERSFYQREATDQEVWMNWDEKGGHVTHPKNIPFSISVILFYRKEISSSQIHFSVWKVLTPAGCSIAFNVHFLKLVYLAYHRASPHR